LPGIFRFCTSGFCGNRKHTIIIRLLFVNQKRKIYFFSSFFRLTHNIKRFIDPGAEFLFVPPAAVAGVAEKFNATAFDVDDVFWSHRNDMCTFDTMIKEWKLDFEPLKDLAKIVRAADTNRHDLAPQAAGLSAISLGLSRMYKDDLAQLDAGMIIYDALFRWTRDAKRETHNWPTSPKVRT